MLRQIFSQDLSRHFFQKRKRKVKAGKILGHNQRISAPANVAASVRQIWWHSNSCWKKQASSFSGVTRVGDTRGGNWGCHPSIFSWKTWRPFLVASSAVSSLVSSLFFSKPGDLFLLFIAFTWVSRVSPPPGVTPHLFYLSDLVSPLFF